MTIPLKNYFIVIDKIHKQKIELMFNVNFFYLKSRSKTISYVNEPFFRGLVTFGLDIKNKMRPLKFTKTQEDGKQNQIPIDPRLFKKFLLADENKFIAFSSQTESKEFAPIMEMLKNFQLDKDKITQLTFCKLCLDEGKFTILDKNIQIKSYKNDIICSNCAMDIIIREAQLIGLLSMDQRINPKLKNFFNHMILKFKDVKKVLSAFKSDFNPVGNREITLYDIEKNPDVSQKYLNYKVKNLSVPGSLKNILENMEISTLLPIQAISIDNGLLSDRKDQLIMAPTSGGKTLVGELAGVSKILMDKKKMLYLVPIVALANIRTEEFKNKYKPLNLRIFKRVGESLLDKKEEDDNLEELINADIIIATYEAIDYILRSGNKERLGSIGTIIIDEIQTLIDPDRGFLLDGFIARLKSLYRNSQYLYLSATIGEPETLAQKLNASLIQYNNRPVPIERHLILALNEQRKHQLISKIVRAAFKRKSKYGFKGQSIIFTNTRKKCEALTAYLQNRNIFVRSYHSGLTTEERKVIELEFQSQKIAGVVATAALAAGVDLPALQVIFESLAMGINWLTVAEFEQMLGRAGRLGKHDLGLTYLLVEPGKVYSPKMKITEENIAIKLLNGKIKDFELIPDEDKSITELLAFISMFNQGIELDHIYAFYDLLINQEYNLDQVLKKLNSLKLIRIKENFIHKPTNLGQSVSKSFLTVDQSLDIIEKLKLNKIESVLDLALDLKPLRNVYISKKIVADLSKNVSMKYFSNNLFSASVLSLMNAEYIKKRKTFSKEFINFITKWINDIFNCNCKDSPYCDCGRLNLENIILNLRINEKLSIEQICEYLNEEYKILVFKGDIIDYLENLIYSFESIKNISGGISNLNQVYIDQISEIPKIIEFIKSN